MVKADEQLKISFSAPGPVAVTPPITIVFRVIMKNPEGRHCKETVLHRTSAKTRNLARSMWQPRKALYYGPVNSLLRPSNDGRWHIDFYPVQRRACP